MGKGGGLLLIPFHALLVICFPVNYFFFNFIWSVLVGQHTDSQYPACISGRLAEPTTVTIPRVQTCDCLMTVTGDMNSG